MISKPIWEGSRVGRRGGRGGSLLEFSSLLDEVVGEGDENSVTVEVVDPELVKHRLLGRSVGSSLGFELRNGETRGKDGVRRVEGKKEHTLKADLVVVDGLSEVLNPVEVIDS